MIALDASRCLGCAACSNVCPNAFITLEQGEERTIRFNRCSEECHLCVEFCPAKALSLVPETEETSITFPLVKCPSCKACYATRPMLDRILSAVPSHLQIDAYGTGWVEICPSCRQDLERDRLSRQVIQRRCRIEMR